MAQSVKLSSEAAAKISSIDSSIVYWSVQLGTAMKQLKEVETQVLNLYKFKETTVLDDLKAQNIDVSDSTVTTLDPSTVSIEKKPPPPPQE